MGSTNKNEGKERTIWNEREAIQRRQQQLQLQQRQPEQKAGLLFHCN